MENFIVKFKNDLKQYQSARRSILKKCEQELILLNKLINLDATIVQDINIISVEESFFIATTLGCIDQAIRDIIDKRKRKKEQGRQAVKILHDRLFEFTEGLKKEYTKTQKIINAFENDKIKDPINDIEALFCQMSFTSLTIEEISKIIGMAISFNSHYAKRNKNHQIENIDIIHQLANDYYNADGSFKRNLDILTFERLIKELIKHNFPGIEAIHRLLSSNELYTTDEIIALLAKSNNIKYQESQKNTHTETTEITDYTISPKVRKALQELRKYYKNGSIVAIPENLDDFYSFLEDTNLDEQEKKYIISLINEEIYKKRNSIISKYLSKNEQVIYIEATTLLNQFSYSNKDVYALKQYIEEIQTILQFLEAATDDEDKEYLLAEIPTIIEQLSIICNRYKIEEQQSKNNLIFLKNKNEIPYILDDIDSLDSTYQKAIYSLINKINPDNQSQFRRILSNEPLPYSMYEVISPRAHVAFVEVDAGIYVIIGANIPRNGYKELNNRLKANAKTIKEIETLIKDPNTRNQVLKDNEEYLPSISEHDEPENKGNKLALKAHK